MATRHHIATFLLTAWVVAAAQVSLDVQPRVVTLGESVTLTLSIEGTGAGATPNLPELDGFLVRGRSSSTSIAVEGNVQRMTVNHQFQLNALRTGTFQIGPFAYDIDGQRFDMPAVSVQVLAPGAAETGATANSHERLFAALSTTPTNLYHQQTFDLVLSIFSAGLNLDRQVGANFNTTGLKVEQLQEVQGGREVQNGRVYDVRRWRGKATALTAGEFHLKPSVQVGLITENRQRNNDPFGGFLGDFFGRRQVQAVDVPVKEFDLTIKPLPEQGRPANFLGAVGRFTFDAQAMPQEVSAGDPVTLQTVIAGEGNIAMLSSPPLQLGDAFRTYDAKLISEEVDAARASGRKVFEQVLIPRNDSVTGLPEIAFTFFNPESAVYETIRRGPLPLIVKASSNAEARVVSAGSPDAGPVQRVLLGTDIGYLKQAPPHWSKTWTPAWLTNPIVLSAQAIPPLAFAALFLLARRRDDLKRDVRKARRQMAPRSARAALAEAEAARNGNQPAACRDAIWKALTAYFANRLNLQPGEVTTDVIAARLQAAGAPDARRKEILVAFSRCEAMRYGMTGAALDAAGMREWIDEVSRILRECEGLSL